METPAPLIAAIRAELKRHRAPLPAQIRALSRLFQLFTTDRGRLGTFSYLDDPALRGAYLRYHLPLNAVRSLCVLRELVAVDPALARTTRNIVDLGAGPGSSSVASQLVLEAAQLEFVLTDRSQKTLGIGRRILAACAEAMGRPAPRVHSVARRLPALPRIPDDSIVWLSMVVNELAARRGRDEELALLFDRLADSVPPSSTVVIVEPALRVPGLRLLRLHDELLQSGRWQVVAPCTHQHACPLLSESGRPWCHFHVDWTPGRFVDAIAAPLGLGDDSAALAWLALRPTTRDGQPPSSPAARVIGDPMNVRGGRRGVYACQDGKRRTLETGGTADIGRGDRVLTPPGKRVTVDGRWSGRRDG